ncbi:MAG TPA: hypothetical protein VE754_02455 [Actinomycetota bacterium]|jgi:hypothetical protein|nr:hypothetical protein [Actinomycetota bacterium]
MDLAGNIVNAVVILAVGYLLDRTAKGRHRELGARVDRLEERLDGRMDGFQSSLDAMRSDLTAVALAVGARPRAENG